MKIRLFWDRLPKECCDVITNAKEDHLKMFGEKFADWSKDLLENVKQIIK